MAKTNDEEKTTNRKKSTGTTRRKSSAKSTGKSAGSGKSAGTTRRKSSSSSGTTSRRKTSTGTTRRKSTSKGTGAATRKSSAKGTSSNSRKKQDLNQQELLFDENGNVKAEDAAVTLSDSVTEEVAAGQSDSVKAEPIESESTDAEPEASAETETVSEPEAIAESEPAEETIVEDTTEEEAAEETVDEESADEAAEEESIEDNPADEESAAEADSVESETEPAEVADSAPFNTAKVFGVVFAALLILAFVLNIVIKDKLYSDQENRVFQQFPEFSVNNYLSGRFESQLDNYANDQFMFRDTFIKIKSSADLTIGQLEANNVFKCEDNYLMEDITYPDKSGVDADIEALKQFKKKYSGKKMYFMLVPNAANVLKSKLPSGVVTHNQNSDMDRLFGAVEALGYKTIDVRDELKKASHSAQIYYRTDHHWTTDGAYVAYKKTAEAMNLKSNIKYKAYAVKKDFIGTLYSKSGFTNGKNDAIKIYLPDDKRALNSVIRYADTKEKTTNYYDMENLNKKDAYTVFGGTNHSLFSISTPTRSNRNLLVIKDSYANCFIPFLTQDYRSITVVDPRYYYENIATVIKANEIDEVLFLYNANTFFSDNYMRMMLTNK